MKQIKNGKYYLVVAPDGYPGKIVKKKYAYAHHFSWWKKTGDIIDDGFHIHHKNEDPSLNSFSNLEKLTVSEHAHRHGKARYADRWKDVSCFTCDKKFQRTKRRLKYNSLRRAKNYCSKTCSGLLGRKKISVTINGTEHGTLNTYMKCGPPKCDLCKRAMMEWGRKRRAKFHVLKTKHSGVV